MPLRVIRRPDTGTVWIIGTVTPAGAKRGLRIRRRAGTNDERLAREEAAGLEAQVLRDFHLGARPAVRGWGEAALSYLDHAERSTRTEALIRRLTLHFRDLPIDRIDQVAVDTARKVILLPDASPATVLRNLISPLRAVLRHAELRGWCRPPRFDVPPQPKGRTRFLLPAELLRLRAAAPAHLRPLITFLVGTGCRSGEAMGLDWQDVDLGGARVLLWEGETKAGTRRVVALPPAVVAALAELPHRTGEVFRRRRQRLQDGRLAPSGYHQADGYGTKLPKGWARAVADAGLDGVTPHVLRHLRGPAGITRCIGICCCWRAMADGPARPWSSVMPI